MSIALGPLLMALSVISQYYGVISPYFHLTTWVSAVSSCKLEVFSITRRQRQKRRGSFAGFAQLGSNYEKKREALHMSGWQLSGGAPTADTRYAPHISSAMSFSTGQ